MQIMPIVYLSVDPVRRQLDFYPKPIAEQIESKFKECSESSDRWGHHYVGSCVLGSQFFNATVHFHSNGMYQTTPGFSMGRAGFKQPGYRSVRRLQLAEDNLNYNIFSKRINGEWRITDIENEREHTFTGEIESQYLINDQIGSFLPKVPKVWESELLDIEDEDDLYVVVWQWCRGIVENEGNLLSLGEEWWIPYFQEQNKLIENCLAQQNESVTIKIPEIEREYIIKVNNGCFGSQENLELSARREIKRSIMTVNDLKNKIQNSRKVLTEMKLLDYINNLDDVPIEFICPISQSIMNNPVKTIDNQVYDEQSIMKWFETKHTSPCTGLHLSDLTLTPFDELREQIKKYKEGKQIEIS